jgi:hypothetical protein
MDGSWLQELLGGEGIREIGEEGDTERAGGEGEVRRTPLWLRCIV